MYVLLCPLPFLHNLFYISQFEEKFENINGDEAPASIPSTSGFHTNPAVQMEIEDGSRTEIDVQKPDQETQGTYTDTNATRDVASGITKIVPEVQIDSEYGLLSEADFSMTDATDRFFSSKGSIGASSRPSYIE